MLPASSAPLPAPAATPSPTATAAATAAATPPIDSGAPEAACCAITSGEICDLSRRVTVLSEASRTSTPRSTSTPSSVSRLVI